MKKFILIQMPDDTHGMTGDTDDIAAGIRKMMTVCGAPPYICAAMSEDELEERFKPEEEEPQTKPSPYPVQPLIINGHVIE